MKFNLRKTWEEMYEMAIFRIEKKKGERIKPVRWP